jgi:hypothetical protein
MMRPLAFAIVAVPVSAFPRRPRTAARRIPDSDNAARREAGAPPQRTPRSPWPSLRAHQKPGATKTSRSPDDLGQAVVA